MRYLTILVALIATMLLAATSASAASPYGTFPNCTNGAKPLSTQAWDATKGVTGGGEIHQHASACFPIFATISSPVDIDVVTHYHNAQGEHANFVRWSDGSNVKQTIKFDLTIPTNAYSRVDTITVDPAKFDYSGWREFRLTANIDVGPKGRWYNTTRWPLYIQNGKSVNNYAWNGSASSHGRCGTAGNYISTYQNVYVDCAQLRDALNGKPISSLAIKAEWQRGVLTADPDFHAGNIGNVLYDGAGGNSWRTVPVTAAGSGPHMLNLRTEQTRSEGVFAGVFTFPVTVQ